MSNIKLVTGREYFSRVKKKSFIIMTLLGPLLLTGFYAAIGFIMVKEADSTETKTYAVVDQSKVFENALPSTENIHFSYERSYDSKALFETDSVSGIISVPSNYTIDVPLKLKYESIASLSVSEQERIEDVFKKTIRQKKLARIGMTQGEIDSLKSAVSVSSFRIKEDGSAESSSIGVNTIIAMVSAMMIYFFIFIYGVQVMKGVIEEKTNRIVEVIISTVKPFELMMGKVIGIALVGLTQLGIWAILTAVLTTILSVAFGMNMMDASQLAQAQANPSMASMPVEMQEALQGALALPWPKIILSFIFFFLTGYLFYGALFAAIGSAVDSETDTQQFMLPVTLPIIFSMVISFSVVINDPNGMLATWMSMIPFSSPIVMMARLPFDPPTWQLLISMFVMILSILGVVWLAARIYRTGILMYGKKPTYKELGKWLFYKN